MGSSGINEVPGFALTRRAALFCIDAYAFADMAILLGRRFRVCRPGESFEGLLRSRFDLSRTTQIFVEKR
jgi:hypothetical protein